MIGYASASHLTAGGDETDLSLATATGFTPTGTVRHPSFFSGFVARPEVFAAALLAIADVAATTYYDLAMLRATLDPVVTAGGDRVRFEAFSRCNGVYARFDLRGDGIDSGDVGFGTTNVDINQPLRTALAGVHRAELMHLDVGDAQLAVSTPDQTHIERQVDLPDRWIRGFAEVPVIASELELAAELDAVQTMTFLASLPRTAPGPTLHYVRTARGLQLSASPARADVRLAGTARLAAAKRITRFARRLRVYRHASGASGWEFDLDGGRLVFVTTPDPYRGFSGEGGLLARLGSVGDDEATTIAEHLAWQSIIDREALVRDAALSPSQVDRAITVLAASGRIGFDLADRAWFHRELPLETDRVTKDNPRLIRARDLVAAGGVVRDEAGWIVNSAPSPHWVRGDPPHLACSCQWQARYGGSRGPCSHVLAVRLTLGTEQPS